MGGFFKNIRFLITKIDDDLSPHKRSDHVEFFSDLWEIEYTSIHDQQRQKKMTIIKTLVAWLHNQMTIGSHINLEEKVGNQKASALSYILCTSHDNTSVTQALCNLAPLRDRLEKFLDVLYFLSAQKGKKITEDLDELQSHITKLYQYGILYFMKPSNKGYLYAKAVKLPDQKYLGFKFQNDIKHEKRLNDQQFFFNLFNNLARQALQKKTEATALIMSICPKARFKYNAKAKLKLQRQTKALLICFHSMGINVPENTRQSLPSLLAEEGDKASVDKHLNGKKILVLS